VGIAEHLVHDGRDGLVAARRGLDADEPVRQLLELVARLGDEEGEVSLQVARQGGSRARRGATS